MPCKSSAPRGGLADAIDTRNGGDFSGISIPVLTPEQFLATYP